jgi:acetyltransferase-like isoleucine patch superfamily enzyme
MEFKWIGKGSKISDWARFYSPEKITIGNNVRVDDFCMLSGGVGIELKDHIHIACGVYMYGGGGILVEDFVGISTHVNIWSQSDDFSGRSMFCPQIPEKYKPRLKKAKVHIGKQVLIGCGVSILPGVTLGEGSIIGAHSLVTKDTLPWSLYAGVPAKKIDNVSQDMLKFREQFLEEYNGKRSA